MSMSIPYGQLTEEQIQMLNPNSTEAEMLRAMSHILEKQERIEGKLETITQAMVDGKVTNSRLDKIETAMQIAKEQSAVNRWLIGVVVTVMLGFMALMATHISWK